MSDRTTIDLTLQRLALGTMLDVARHDGIVHLPKGIIVFKPDEDSDIVLVAVAMGPDDAFGFFLDEERARDVMHLLAEKFPPRPTIKVGQ